MANRYIQRRGRTYQIGSRTPTARERLSSRMRSPLSQGVTPSAQEIAPPSVTMPTPMGLLGSQYIQRDGRVYRLNPSTPTPPEPTSTIEMPSLSTLGQGTEQVSPPSSPYDTTYLSGDAFQPKESALTRSFLPKWEDEGVLASIYNKAVRPIASPAGIGVVGAFAAAPLAIGAGLTTAIGGTLAAGFGAKALYDMPEEIREYREALTTGDKQKISDELADLYIRGAEVLGGVIGPLAAFRGVSKIKLKKQMDTQALEIERRAAAYMEEFKARPTAVKKTATKTIAGETVLEEHFALAKTPFLEYTEKGTRRRSGKKDLVQKEQIDPKIDPKTGRIKTEYYRGITTTDKYKAQERARQLAERDFLMDELMKEYPGRGKQKAVRPYNEYSLMDVSDKTIELGIITSNPHLIRAAQTTKSDSKGLAAAWNKFHYGMLQSGRETLLRMGRTYDGKFVRDVNGERVTYMMDESTHMGRRLAHLWSVKATEALKGLKKDELKQIPGLIEGTKLKGKIDPKSPAARDAKNWKIPKAPEHLQERVSRLQDIFAEMGQMSMHLGVRVKRHTPREGGRRSKVETKAQTKERIEGKWTDWMEDELGVEKFEAWGRDYWPRLLPSGRLQTTREH